MFASLYPFLGNTQIGLGNQDIDASPQMVQGQIMLATDPFWGAGEFVYMKAAANIRAMGLCIMTTAYVAGNNRWEYWASEAPSTANMGRPVAVCMGSLLAEQWGWFMVSGNCPVNCNASLSGGSSSPLGLAATGQGGAVTAGKEVLGAVTRGSASATIVKAGCSAPNGSLVLQVPSSDGWFTGVYLSGTGIAAGTTVVSIDSSGRFVTLSLATTAAVNGSVTATYNNGTVFYNQIYLNRPTAQGQIT